MLPGTRLTVLLQKPSQHPGVAVGWLFREQVFDHLVEKQMDVVPLNVVAHRRSRRVG